MEKNLEAFGIRVADADFKDERKDAVESLKDWQSKDESSRCFFMLAAEQSDSDKDNVDIAHARGNTSIRRLAGLLTAAAFADEVVAAALFRANENVLNAIKEEFPEEFKGSDFRRAQSIIKKLNEERNE